MRIRVPVLAFLLVLIASIAIVSRGANQVSDDGPTPAMNGAIKDAAIQETQGDMHVDRLDYVGRHDNGGGAVGFIFYVYFSDASRLKYERFVRVLRTEDGTLHVLAA